VLISLKAFPAIRLQSTVLPPHALRQSDYETLYQADRHRTNWLSSATGLYQNSVEVDAGRQICRAANELWLGVVQGKQCVGETYSGRAAATPLYEGLYHAP
jgi:hypothetical protein